MTVAPAPTYGEIAALSAATMPASPTRNFSRISVLCSSYLPPDVHIKSCSSLNTRIPRVIRGGGVGPPHLEKSGGGAAGPAYTTNGAHLTARSSSPELAAVSARLNRLLWSAPGSSLIQSTSASTRLLMSRTAGDFTDLDSRKAPRRRWQLRAVRGPAGRPHAPRERLRLHRAERRAAPVGRRLDEERKV